MGSPVLFQVYSICLHEAFGFRNNRGSSSGSFCTQCEAPKEISADITARMASLARASHGLCAFSNKLTHVGDSKNEGYSMLRGVLHVVQRLLKGAIP